MFLLLMYILLLVLPVILSYVVRKKLQGVGGYFLTAIFSALLMTSTVVYTWLNFEVKLEEKVAVLDRDGDGSWSKEEKATWTLEEKSDLDVFMGDGGRNVFAAIIFPIFSVVYSALVVGIYWLISIIWNRKKKPNNTL